jgi:hypothetical protein
MPGHDCAAGCLGECKEGGCVVGSDRSACCAWCGVHGSCGGNGACGTVRRDRLYVTVVSWAAGYRPSTPSMRLGELMRVPVLHWRRGWLVPAIGPRVYFTSDAIRPRCPRVHVSLWHFTIELDKNAFRVVLGCADDVFGTLVPSGGAYNLTVNSKVYFTYIKRVLSSCRRLSVRTPSEIG